MSHHVRKNWLQTVNTQDWRNLCCWLQLVSPMRGLCRRLGWFYLTETSKLIRMNDQHGRGWWVFWFEWLPLSCQFTPHINLSIVKDDLDVKKKKKGRLACLIRRKFFLEIFSGFKKTNSEKKIQNTSQDQLVLFFSGLTSLKILI